MSPLNIGIQLKSLRQPFKKALQTAAKIGASAVEIDIRSDVRPQELSETGVRHLRKMLEDLELKVCAVNFPTRRGYDVAEDLDRRIDATKRAMQFAFTMGASVVVNQVGNIPEEPGTEEWDLLVQSLSDLGRYGQHVGALLAARTGTEEGGVMSRLLAALPEGMVGVDLDPGGLIINGFSAREATEVLADRILHVHARDGVRDLARGRGVEVPLGMGTAELPELLGILAERRYRGFFTIEREQAVNPAAEIGDAVAYLKAL